MCLVGQDVTHPQDKERNARFPSAVSVISADGQLEQGGRQIITHSAAVESRVGHENEEAAESERQNAYGQNPVADPDPARVPGAP